MIEKKSLSYYNIFIIYKKINIYIIIWKVEMQFKIKIQ